ncbi:hypothetical protein MJO29_011882 [Puccinia striiformis f. sp. tritici]|nr:hypothetical protein MJO29_011882 [Puccinia striiformis f. sp. tritici]
MRQYSERQGVIRELFTLLLLQHDDDNDDLITQMYSLPGSPTIGTLLFPDDPEMMFVIDELFNDEADLGELIQTIMSSRYLNTRAPPVFRDEFDLARLFQMRSVDFKQATRTTKEAFVWLLNRIYLHQVFHNNSFRPQLPVPHQLALALERLGSNGNGASVGRCARNLNVARGTVIKVTRRVIEAITSLGPQYVVWPNESCRREISDVMKQEGFEGCIGFVDGTTIRLFQRPAIDGHVFWDRKKQYSINCQIICDCDRYITCFMTGWPGSCGDSMVYKRMALYDSPGDSFDPGQYLIADAAYSLTMTTLPPSKAPAANLSENIEFNYCLAKSRVRNEHTIGILKARWSSLKEMRLHLFKPEHMQEYIRWIYACIILHNMLASLGDAWVDLADSISDQGGDEDENTDSNSDVSPNEADMRDRFCNKIKRQCRKRNYELGTLPIP